MMWKVLLLCTFIVAASALATLHCDEICGVTDIPTSIPSLETDQSAVTYLDIQSFRASFAAGFTLHTVGGIAIDAQDGLSFSTPGNIDLIAAVSGGVTLRANEVDFSAEGYISFWAQNEGIIDAKEDITFKVDPDNDEGTVNFNSDFGTHVSASLGMILSASQGEVRVLAPEGVVKLHADQIGVTSGNNPEDVFELVSGDLFVIAADREFNVLTAQDVNITADSKVTFTSKYNDIKFESSETFNVFGNSNVILSASAGFTLESLLDDITLTSDQATSIYARQFRTSSNTATLTADELLNYQSSGNINLLAVNDVALTTRFTANAFITDNLYVTGRTNGEVRVDINALDATCSNLKVRAADTRLSGIYFEASDIEFITYTADITAHTNFLRFQAPVVNITATHDAILAATGFHFVDPANNYEDGALTWLTVGDTLFDAADSLTILSDQSQLLFDDAGEIRLTVGKTLSTGSAQFANFDGTDIDFTAKNGITFYATDAGFYTQSQGDQTYTIAKDFSATGTTDNDLYVDNNFDIQASAVTTKTTVGSTLIYTKQSTLNAGGKITFTDNAHDHQHTNVNVGHIVSLTGGSVDIDSETQELSFKVPSGGGVFDASNNIAFNLGYGYFTSVAESIDITGTTDYTAQTGLYFRAGDAVSMIASGGNLHFTSTSVDIESASQVVAQSNQLLITTTLAHFHGDAQGLFRSFADFDFSPNVRGDVEIHGGRVDLSSVLTLNLTANEIAQSSGNGLDIEFNVGVGGSFIVTETAGISFVSDYFHLQAIEALNPSGQESTFFSNKSNVALSATAGDFTLRAFSAGAGFLVQAKTDVAYSGASFLYESNFANNALSFFADEEINIAASSRADFETEGNIVWTVGGDLTWTGANFDLEYNENQQQTPSTFTSAFTKFTTCNGDWRSITDHYAMSGLPGGITVFQNTGVCGTSGKAGNFLILTDAIDTQSYTASTATFSGTNDLQVTTGRAKFETGPTGTTLTVTSGTYIDINSLNTDSYLFDEAHDYVYAGRDVIVTAATYISLQSNGLAGYALSNQENLRGFEVDLNEGNLVVTSVKDAITFKALEQYIEFWTGDEILLTNKNDLLVHGGEGRVQLTANGNIVNTQANSTSGIEFWAPNGDLSVKTDQASITISSAKENYVQTLIGKIDFTAGYSFSHTADQLGGVISYNTLLGSLSVTSDLNITLTAGNQELNANIDILAARDVNVITLQDQRYITTGPAPAGEDSIIILAEEGDIDISSSNDQQVYASGDATFQSTTSTLSLTARGDITLNSVAEVRINSTLTSTVTVTRGDINLDAGGGGGSVDIISDGAQSITAIAGGGINVGAEDTVQIHAQTGLGAVTQKGSILFKQTGDYQHTDFHSDGSILLQATRDDGILLSGLSTRIAALRDVTFDATDSWSVGSTALDSTATQPRIEFHGGGDYGIVGVEIDVNGGMSWTTNKIGPITFDANRAIWTSVGDMDFTANGPVYFINHGEFNEAVFTMTAGGLLTLDAGAAVEIKSNATSSITVPNHISLSSSGGLPLDTSFIKVANNWKVQTTTLTTTTDVLEGELRDMLIDVSGQILITNTVGDGGSLKFESDWWFVEKSEGPTSFTANGITTILTEAPYSDIIFDSAADLNLISGGSIQTEGQSTSLDAPHGLVFTTVGGDIEFVASDDIIVASNDTLTLTGFDALTVQSGFTNTGAGLLSSPVNISSRGDLTVQSQADTLIQTLGTTDDLRVVADVDLLVQNRVPTKNSDQGDIRIDSPGSGYYYATGDLGASAGRDIYLQSTIGDFTADGDFTATATASQASVSIQGESAITFNAYNELVLAATTSLTFTATGDLTWNQVNEEGLGGIFIGSDAGRTTINGPRQLFFTAESAIEGDAPYFLFSSERSILIQTAPFGGDVQFKSASTIAFTTTDDFTVGSTDATVTNTVKIISDPSAGGASAISFTAPTTFSVNTENHQISFLGNQLNIVNPNTTNSVQTYTADETVAVIAQGVDPNTRFGIRIETDETQVFTASDDLAINANLGLIFMTASENFNIIAASDIYVGSGNNVLISTGFTVEPNFSLLYRRGIVFESVADSSYRSNKGSVNFYGEDSSWTINQGITIRSLGDGFFGSSVGNVQWTGQSVNGISNSAYFHTEGDFNVVNAQTFTMQSRGSTILYSDDADFTGTVSLTLAAEEGILFTTPQGAVDFTGTVFKVPRLFKEGGLSGFNYDGIFPQAGAYDQIGPLGRYQTSSDFYRNQEENQYPICKERSFGWDSYTNAFCYCDFNKWRCIQSIAPP